MDNKFDGRGAIILGMHDAIVSLTGLIAGLYFAFTNPDIIIVSCIISSVTASLSMGAANYLAVKSTNQNLALISAVYTGSAYMITCALLILPFFVFKNQLTAFFSVIIIAMLIIYLFNRFFYRGTRFYKRFFEMITICTVVSIIAFMIGEVANKIFGF